MKSLTIRTVPFSLCSITFMLFWLQPWELLLKDQWQLVQRTPKCIKRHNTSSPEYFQPWLFRLTTASGPGTEFCSLPSGCSTITFFTHFFTTFSFSNLPDTAFFLQSLRGVVYCMLKDKICIESSNFIWVKIIYKNPKTYFMKLVQTIFPAVGFCSKDHSWEILYKIKIGLDSEKYSTVLISNWEYLHKYLQWKKSYFKTLICKLASSTL